MVGMVWAAVWFTVGLYVYSGLVGAKMPKG